MNALKHLLMYTSVIFSILLPTIYEVVILISGKSPELNPGFVLLHALLVLLIILISELKVLFFRDVVKFTVDSLYTSTMLQCVYILIFALPVDENLRAMAVSVFVLFCYTRLRGKRG